MARYNTSLASATITGATTVGTPNNGAFTNLTGTAPYTVTLPSPSLFPGSNQTFYNATAGTVTLSTPNGAFNGTGGSGTSSVSIFSSNVVSVTSDGTNYIVISEDGSAMAATTGSFTSNVTVGGTLTVQSSGGVSMAPSSAGNIDNVAIGVNARSSGAFTTLSANAQVSFTANTTSTSTTSGSLVVTGGIGVSGNLNSGGNITATNVTANLTGTIQTAAQPNITSTGSLTLPGLTVNGVSSLNGRTTAKDTINADTSYPLAIQNGSQQPWWLRAGTTSNTFSLHLNGTGDLVSILTSGNVGIATTSPQTKLDVAGSIIARGDLFFGTKPSNTLTTGVSNTDWHHIGYAGDTNYHVTGSIQGDMTIGAVPGTGITFGTVATGQPVPLQRMYISRDGGIGINTVDFSYSQMDNVPNIGSRTNNKLFVNGSIQLLSNDDALVVGRGTSSFYKDEEIGFGWGGGWLMQDTTYLRVRNNKIIYSTGHAALSGIINTSPVGANSASGNTIGSYVLGNGRWWNTGGGAIYIHILLPARYNQDNSRMFCLEIKGYDFAIPRIFNMMVGGYVTPPSNGGPMSRVAVWDATNAYSPTAYYSSNYARGVVRFYMSDKYYASFTVNSIASGNGDVIAPDELQIIESTNATI